MEFIAVSDVHLSIRKPENRVDDVVNKTQWEKLDQIFSLARKRKCPIIQAGDFCDVPRSWYLLPKLTSFLKKYKDVKVYCVFGQHDTYYYSEELRSATILGELEEIGYVTILNENPVKLTKSVRLYGCSYSGNIPKIKDKTKFNVLVIHAPISTKPTFYYHKYLDAKSFLRMTRFDLIICGDIHRKFKVRLGKRFIVNTGPILRLELTEYNLRHRPCLFLVETENRTIKTKYLSVEDSSKVFKNNKPPEAAERRGNKLFEKLKQENVKLNSLSFRDNLSRIIKAMKFTKYEKTVLDEILEKTEKKED